jgi:hypothetical protein
LRDRIAIARLRKLVLELGQTLAPEQLETKLGPLNLWIAAPVSELDDRSPMADMEEPGGDERLLVYLSKVLETASKQTPPAASQTLGTAAATQTSSLMHLQSLTTDTYPTAFEPRSAADDPSLLALA